MYWLFPSINPYIGRLQLFHKKETYDYDFEHINALPESEYSRDSVRQ